MDVGDDGGGRKPTPADGPLSTAQWWGYSRQLSPEERGFALSALALMSINGWQSPTDLPAPDDLARRIKIAERDAERLLPILWEIPTDILLGQLAKIKDWPADHLQVFVP